MKVAINSKKDFLILFKSYLPNGIDYKGNNPFEYLDKDPFSFYFSLALEKLSKDYYNQVDIEYLIEIYENLPDYNENVDFDLLKKFQDMLSSNTWVSNKEINSNLRLFFELLSKSSSFAHKAHKELNKRK